ncbi:MAG TPA: CAP domain-containing protein [Armatimonadota bacterium]|nr:CAP domain-containing protein [Armatimonadota bacterium]
MRLTRVHGCRALDGVSRAQTRNCAGSFFSCCIAVALALFASQAPAHGMRCVYLPPSPTGTVQIARPNVEWVLYPEDGSAVTGVNMLLNGTRVPASYSAARHAVEYLPPRALAPGQYTVYCRLTIDGAYPMKKGWSFTVPPHAVELSAPDSNQRSLLDIVNAYRRIMGLHPMNISSPLCAAAAAHSRYLEINRLSGHVESPAEKDFLGVDPWDRAAAYGYAGFGCEDVAEGEATPAAAVRSLMNAPYHRAAFMEPGTPDFGASLDGDRATFDFGRSDTTAVVVYPTNGQRNIPTAWQDDESPDPLALHHVSGVVGYPITLFSFSSSQNDPVASAQASLTDAAGDAIPFYLNTPADDTELTNGIFLIPTHPLSPHTTYVVSVRGATASGRDISRRWSFTTGG